MTFTVPVTRTLVIFRLTERPCRLVEKLGRSVKNSGQMRRSQIDRILCLSCGLTDDLLILLNP